MNEILLPISAFFPMAAGCGCLLLGKTGLSKKTKHLLVLAAMAAALVLTVASMWNPCSMVLWQLTSTLQISFRVDGLSRLFGILSASVWLLVGIFAFDYLSHGEHEDRFFGFYLIVEGTIIAQCLSANLVTFYVFFELMTFTALPLVLHELTKPAIMAGLKYLFYSVAGAFMALFGVFFLAGYGGLGDFAPGGILTAAGNEPILLVSVLLMLMGFGTKAGMFPMHGWLPTAHPEAPAPASAVLSGVITKMGVLAIIRTVYYVVGADLLRGTWVQQVWLTLSLATVFMGSMMAYKENIMKKRFAYSTVSQVSYMLFGLALLNKTAFIGALAHVVFHSAVKNTLFLNAGAIIFKTGKTKIDQLRGIGKEMPIAIWCFTLVSLTLIGIPPTSGFISKWYLATGALESGIAVFSWLGPVILLVSALLTAGYLLPITIHGFFPGKDFSYETLESKEPSYKMLLPLLVLTAAAVLFGMFPGGLLRFLSAIAEALF